MAAGQLSLTRRALLAGACAAPLAGRAGDGVAGPLRGSSGGEGRWQSALQRLDKPEGLLAQADETQDERLYDRLGARRDAALKAVLRIRRRISPRWRSSSAC